MIPTIKIQFSIWAILWGLTFHANAQLSYLLSADGSATGTGYWDDTFYIHFDYEESKEEIVMVKIAESSSGKVITSFPKEVYYGENRWSFSPKSLGLPKINDLSFFMYFQTKKNARYQLLFQVKVVEQSLGLEMDVEALTLNCTPESTSEISFFPTVKYEQVPFEVTWLVSTDMEGLNLLMQPKTDVFQSIDELEKEVFKLDISTPKYVTVFVRDICKRTVEQVYILSCAQDKAEDFMVSFQTLKPKTGTK